MKQQLELKHFKLTNGDELVCDVLEWNDENTDEIVISKALKLVQMDDPDTGIRYFSFRPWMLLQENLNDIQILNGAHIVAEANPTNKMLTQYMLVYDEIQKYIGDDEEIEVQSSLDFVFAEV